MRRRKKSCELSTAALSYLSCPAKTFSSQQHSSLQPGRNVFNHCQIVGETARQLIGRYPDPLRSQLFPRGSELAAAAHDIGKVSPTFAAKIFKACGIDYKTKEV